MRRLLTTLALISFSLAIQAEVRTQDVRYQIEDEEFTGYLAYDDALDGKRPGVLVIHEWWGLSDYEKRRARISPNWAMSPSPWICTVAASTPTIRIKPRPGTTWSRRISNGGASGP